jgi:hypothetical protein
MANFPRLSTGAVTQYPSSRNITYPTHVLRFVDGREQRFRELSGPVRSWMVRLHQLSAEEMGALEMFFRERQGQFGSFTFVDPWDGTEYPDCSFDQQVLSAVAMDERRYQGHLIIRNNRP